MHPSHHSVPPAHEEHVLPSLQSDNDVSPCDTTPSQEQADTEIQRFQARASNILESITDAFVFLDTETKFDYVNQHAETLLGLPRQELIGRTIREVFPEAVHSAFLEQFHHALKEGVSVSFEQFYPPDARWYSVRAYPAADGLAVYFQDATARREAEAERERLVKELEAERGRLQAALQAGKMGIWEWDMRTNDLAWSAETERLFGLEPGGFDGTYETYQSFLHPDERATIRQNIARSVENKIPFEHEHRVVLRDGSIRWLSGKGGAVYDEQGKPVRMLGIVADITDRKRLEQQFLQAQKMEGIGRLAGGIAHDFNNLLSVILGYAEMMEMEIESGSDLLKNVHHIQGAASRAARLTSQLLAFARKQVGEVKIIRPNELIAGMSQILKPLIREDIELVTLLKEEAGSINSDPSQIEQIVVNLVLNARDAMPTGGKILLQTENVMLDAHYLQDQNAVKPGEYVLIAVSDTGIGMTEDVKRHLFEPFFTTKEVGKGTGLGLATVYGIVKQNGGYIFCYSEVGNGTTIKIYLPRIREASSVSRRLDKVESELTGTETVIVVEDEKLVRDLTVQTLRRHGYVVMEAENGKEALRVLEQFEGKIDLVVTDAIMPEMGGKEMVDRLREVRPGTNVLYVSGYTEEITLVQGILPEGTAFLQKPFTTNGLLTRVREILGPTERVSEQA